MVIGGILVVCNEERLVERNIRYHLAQGFDVLLIMDDGSHDNTVKVVEAIQDPRVNLIELPYKGFGQDKGFTQSAQELFSKRICDWVLPIDADEFWVSRRFGTVRKALEAIQQDIDILTTHSYLFYPTERDNPDEPDPIVRQQYASIDRVEKVVMHRLGDRIRYVPIGAHQVYFVDDQPFTTAPLDLDDLCRFHYRHLSRNDFRRRIMTQAEGYIARLGTNWLSRDRNEQYARRILIWYHRIRNGTFDQLFDDKFLWKEAELDEKLANGEAVRLTDMKTLMNNFGNDTGRGDPT